MTRTLAFLLFLTSIGVKSQDTKYQLVWADEFNHSALDTNFWTIEVNGHGGGNNELQYYTDKPSNIRFEEGMLVIEAHKEQYLGKQYTSARIKTQKKAFWRYGRIEARMKLPYGQGMWPAFWMLGENISSLGWPKCGEIDIMEMIGGKANDSTVYSTLHWANIENGGHKQHGDTLKLNSGKLADDFHIYAAEWDENTIKAYCDSTCFFTININTPEMQAFHKDFFIILNYAVGGNWPGSPDETTVFPQKMLVDYVRVYKKQD